MTVLDSAKGSFVTAPHLDLQSIAGFGFRPVAIVAWWARQSHAGVERGNRGGVGFWTEAAAGAVTWFSADGEAAARTGQLGDNAALLGLDGSGARVALGAQVQSFDPDGVTLRYTVPPSEEWIVHFLALGGPCVTAARVGWSSSSAVPNSVGRRRMLLLAPAPAELGVTVPGLTIGFGAVGARGEAVCGYTCRDGGPPGEVIGMQRRSATIQDWDQVCYLSMEGIHTEVGTDVAPERSGRRKTRAGARPDALMLFSWGLARSDEVRSIGRLCVGASAGGRSGCISWDDRNVSAHETSTHVQSSTDDVLIVADTRSGGTHARAALASVSEGGFVLDWSNDRDRREFAYAALTGREPRGRLRRLLDRLRGRSELRERPPQRQRSASS